MLLKKACIVASACIVLLLAGCMGNHQYKLAVNSWQGVKVARLFSAWGYPSRIAHVKQGHQLFIYYGHGRGAHFDKNKHHPATLEKAPAKRAHIKHHHSGCKTWFEVSKNRVISGGFHGKRCSLKG